MLVLVDVVIIVDSSPPFLVERTILDDLPVFGLFWHSCSCLGEGLLHGFVLAVRRQFTHHSQDTFAHSYFSKTFYKLICHCYCRQTLDPFIDRHVVEGFALLTGKLVCDQREEILIARQLGIGRQIDGEGIFRETSIQFVDNRIVQFAHTGAFLHAVTYVVSDHQRIGGHLTHGHRSIVREDFRIPRIPQSQNQHTVLKIEELTAAIGSTLQEVVKRLVVLHQIGLYEL